MKGIFSLILTLILSVMIWNFFAPRIAPGAPTVNISQNLEPGALMDKAKTALTYRQ